MESWVKLRHKCSPLEVFLDLKEGSKSDVEERNSLRKDGDPLLFKVKLHNGQAFSVIREGSPVYGVVRFAWDSSGIVVQDREDKILAKATLTLTDEKQCKLRIADGLELEPWQFRKRFLEDLFFP
jgi:hypothetical protein